MRQSPNAFTLPYVSALHKPYFAVKPNILRCALTQLSLILIDRLNYTSAVCYHTTPANPTSCAPHHPTKPAMQNLDFPDFPAYPAYKPSGIEWLGDIPSHWDTRRLRYVAEMRVSNVDKHIKLNENPVRLCNYVDVYHNERISADLDFMRATATDRETDNAAINWFLCYQFCPWLFDFMPSYNIS